MAGHSKWKNIQHRKGSVDQRRAKTFTKHSKNITLAAQEGADPSINFQLRVAIQQARADNMPSENIEKAIKKGVGAKDADRMQTVVYEALTSSGVAVLIKCQTDNPNRSLTEVRTITEHRFGGKLVSAGKLAWKFSEVGELEIELDHDLSADHQETVWTNLAEIPGVEEIEMQPNAIRLTVTRESLRNVYELLGEAGYKVTTAQLGFKPNDPVGLSEVEWSKLEQYLDALEDSEEVDSIYVGAK